MNLNTEKLTSVILKNSNHDTTFYTQHNCYKTPLYLKNLSTFNQKQNFLILATSKNSNALIPFTCENLRLKTLSFPQYET